ncbi:MAG: hypothetical protein ACI4UJ_02255 [Candidatus Cryptobacteroides sp.]
MKIRLTSIALAAAFCTACFPTRIVTVSEPISSTPSYSTVVTMPKTHVTTTTTQVYATEPDISLYLDLQAVAAAFAQSSSIREFESLLNNSSYIISNLDLNRDGYVDYLRVVSAMQGYNHVFVIQAALGPNVFQDVATVVAEVPAYGNYTVEVIGSSYIYGPNYIIRPVYYTRPIIFDHICRYDYRPWKSPWYWNHYPTYYRHPAPVHVNHYHAYVSTFMKNHRYCHEVHYYNTCHYPNYQRLCTTICRDDYGRQYPERSFTVRNANVAVNNSAVTRAENARTQANAYDVRMAYDATKTTTTSATRSTASSSGSSATRGTSSTSGSSATRGTTGSSGSSATRGTSATTGTSATRGTSTSSSSTGSASRGTATTGTSGTSTRGTTSGTSTSRGSASTSTTTGRSTGTSATRGTSSSSTATRGSSTTSSRVQSSGSSSTRTSTTTATGQQSTVRRGSSSSSATRSTGTSTATRSSGTSTSSTRSTGTTSTTRR